MTQPTSGTAFGLTITRIINAPRERVFAAWTDPDHLHRWWGAQDGYTAPIVEVDLRPGGRYRFGMQDPEQAHPYIVGGEYREVNPPEKLVFTWIWEKMPLDISDWVPPATLVTVEFFDRDGATEIGSPTNCSPTSICGTSTTTAGAAASTGWSNTWLPFRFGPSITGPI